MSKKEEILHKLSTEDRNYIKKKFKEREEFCIGQVESLTNLINVLIEENKELVDENFRLETKLAESERLLEKHCYKNIQELEDVFNYNLNQVAILSQQLAEKDAEVQSWKDGTMVVKLCKLEEQLAEKEKEIQELKRR